MAEFWNLHEILQDPVKKSFPRSLVVIWKARGLAQRAGKLSFH
jgi:hypothetical protein